MSNYHILDNRADGNQLRIIMHIPVPDTVNLVGVNYRMAAIQYLGGEQISALPWIDAAEQTQLDAGELYEHTVQYNTYPGQSLADKRAAIDALYMSLSVSIFEKLQTRLQYWGYDRDVP